MTTAGKTWRRRKRERPNEIRAAALIEFSNRTFDAVTMEEIAQRAGITKATIYLYYASKTELFDELRNYHTASGSQRSMCRAPGDDGTQERNTERMPSATPGVRGMAFVEDARAVCPFTEETKEVS